MKRPYLWSLSIALVGLLIWEIVVRTLGIHEYLLPAPFKILTYLLQHISELAFHAAITLSEAGLGFLVANVAAILTAVAIVYAPGMDRAVMPFAIALKTTPIVAMAPLLLLWFGNGIAPKVAAAALICFFPALVNSLKGFHALGDGEADLFHVYGAAKTQMLLKLRLPRAAPFIFSALKVSSSLSIVGAIVGEFVGANQGIGYVILVSSYHLDSVRMFASLTTAAVAGTVFYGLVALADRRMVFWQTETDDVRLDSPGSRKRSPQQLRTSK